MNSLPASIAYINETDVRGQALLALIVQYAKSFGFLKGYYGFRPIGANPGLTFPCVMIDPVSQKPWMATLGKFRLQITYNIYWYCQDSSPDAIVSQATAIAEYLIKLLSNNALGDGSTNFKQYVNPAGGFYWLDSDMSQITWSTSFQNATPDSLKTYMRAGMMTFTITDQKLK